MKVIKRKKRTINEDDIQDVNNTTDTSQEVQQATQNQAKSKTINDQIVNLMNQKLQRKTQYQNDIKNIETQIVQLEKQKADLGEDVDTNIIESYNKAMKISFWRKLCEAAINRTDEMFALIKISFYSIDNLSYTPDDTWCKTFARRIVEHINDVAGQDLNRDDMVDFITNYVNAGRISLSSREKTEFINNLVENLEKSPMFNYTIKDKEE